MFLSANNFFWRIDLRGRTMTRIAQWRNLGRPEASLIGVQYIGNDMGEHRGPWLVRPAAARGWVFAGVKLRDGNAFSDAGIEIDAVAPSSPRGHARSRRDPEPARSGDDRPDDVLRDGRRGEGVLGRRVHARRLGPTARRPAPAVEPVGADGRRGQLSRRSVPLLHLAPASRRARACRQANGEPALCRSLGLPCGRDEPRRLSHSPAAAWTGRGRCTARLPASSPRPVAGALARAALGPQSGPAVLRRPAALRQREPRRRPPRHRFGRVLARPSRDGPARGRPHRTAKAHHDLGDGAVLRCRLSPALVAPERGDAGRLLRDAVDGGGRERQPEDLRRQPTGNAVTLEDSGRANPRRGGGIREAQLRATRAGPARRSPPTRSASRSSSSPAARRRSTRTARTRCAASQSGRPSPTAGRGSGRRRRRSWSTSASGSAASMPRRSPPTTGESASRR